MRAPAGPCAVRRGCAARFTTTRANLGSRLSRHQRINVSALSPSVLAIAAAAERVDVPAIRRFEELLAQGVPRIDPRTPTVTEALLACLGELAAVT